MRNAPSSPDDLPDGVIVVDPASPFARAQRTARRVTAAALAIMASGACAMVAGVVWERWLWFLGGLLALLVISLAWHLGLRNLARMDAHLRPE